MKCRRPDCGLAGQEQPVGAFHVDKRRGRRRTTCKECSKRAKQESRNRRAPSGPPPVSVSNGQPQNADACDFEIEIDDRPSARPAGGGRLRTIAILPDAHVPEHDRLAWSAVRQWIRESQPDEIIILGDFLELASVSMHGGSADLVRLETDIAAGNKALDELRSDAPLAETVFMEGNHETRLNRFLFSFAPALYGSLSVEKGLRLEERGIRWVPEDQQPIARGSLDLIHGQQMPGMGGLYHARKLIDTYGRPGRTVVCGHYHRPQTLTKPGHPDFGGYECGVALGCLRTIGRSEVKWTHGQATGWVHQFGVAYVQGARADLYPVTITRGAFVWAGQAYHGVRE